MFSDNSPKQSSSLQEVAADCYPFIKVLFLSLTERKLPFCTSATQRPNPATIHYHSVSFLPTVKGHYSNKTTQKAGKKRCLPVAMFGFVWSSLESLVWVAGERVMPTNDQNPGNETRPDLLICRVFKSTLLDFLSECCSELSRNGPKRLLGIS